MITLTRTLLALAVVAGTFAITPLADGAVEPKKRNDCAASVANLKDKIATLDGDKAEILSALETAIKKNMACAQWLAAATIQATNADPSLVGEISFVAFSTADASMKSAIAGAIRDTANGTGASNGGGAYVYGKSPVGDGQLLGPDQAAKIDSNGITLIDFSELPPSMRDALGNDAFAKLGDATFSSQLLSPFSRADAAIIGAISRVFGPGVISPIAPTGPVLPPERPDKPSKPDKPSGGGGGNRPPPVSPPNFTPRPPVEPPLELDPQ